MHACIHKLYIKRERERCLVHLALPRPRLAPSATWREPWGSRPSNIISFIIIISSSSTTTTTMSMAMAMAITIISSIEIIIDIIIDINNTYILTE